MKFILFISCLLSGLLWAHDESSHAEETNHQQSIARGPHDGRLFKKDDLSLELSIYENAMPPHFRAYLYDKGNPVKPGNAQLMVQLKRFNGKIDKITFLNKRPS